MNDRPATNPSAPSGGPGQVGVAGASGAPMRSIVLLVDDQLIIGEAVRRIAAPHGDIEYHFCQKPEEAIAKAIEVKPTVILQDLVMPGVDGLDLVRDFRAREETRLTPLIVLSSKEEGVTKAEAFARGANDYIVKLPDPLELVARIRYHSRGYIALLERNAAFNALHESQQALAAELAKAAAYVQSLLPRPCESTPEHPVAIDWRFVPSASLGGDSFDYFWIDDDHLALYLLDVCGHGVGPALLSVSVMNMLRNRGGGADRRDPAAVMREINAAFRMDRHGSMYFTIWYGVFDRRTRELAFSGGGHPPALLLVPADAVAGERSEGGATTAAPMNGGAGAATSGAGPAPIRIEPLESTGLPIGIMRNSEFETSRAVVPPGASLLLYSDGAIEVFIEPGIIWGLGGLTEFMRHAQGDAGARLDALLVRVREIEKSDVLPDDLSVVLARFDSM
ncbi:MAG: SpoIIE family protein phosphatase [Phycisphaerales bacterium]